MNQSTPKLLRREIGVVGAMMMGLGSIVGTGAFVSIGIAADIGGSTIILATVLAAMVAACNGLSSAQLAANHAVSGGSYEYGHRWLTPQMGFTAGWLFLSAKSASAATAALGFAGYLLYAFGFSNHLLTPLALLTLLGMTTVVLSGIRRSNLINVVIVSVTIATLIYFITAGLTRGAANALFFHELRPTGAAQWKNLLHATALMFVAYTGYGRIATLGEEVLSPRKTIPLAVVVTLVVAMALYVGVAVVVVGAVGVEALGVAAQSNVAPLQMVAEELALPAGRWVMAVGAMTAMLGVLLNLLLGLSRTILAMARRRDMPSGLTAVHPSSQTPWAATIAVACIVAALVAVGDVRLTWSFSAFTVLIYYAITNLCAIRLKVDERIFPVWPAYVGLTACILLAFWVQWKVWLAGLGLIAIGIVWKWAASRLTRRADERSGG